VGGTESPASCYVAATVGHLVGLDVYDHHSPARALRIAGLSGVSLCAQFALRRRRVVRATTTRDWRIGDTTRSMFPIMLTPLVSLPGLTGQSSTRGRCLLDRPVKPGDDSESVNVDLNEKRVVPH